MGSPPATCSLVVALEGRSAIWRFSPAASVCVALAPHHRPKIVQPRLMVKIGPRITNQNGTLSSADGAHTGRARESMNERNFRRGLSDRRRQADCSDDPHSPQDIG